MFNVLRDVITLEEVEFMSENLKMQNPEKKSEVYEYNNKKNKKKIKKI